MSGVAAAAMVDDLFRTAVAGARSVDEPMLAEWAAEAGELTGPDRELTRAVRRAVRSARKLAAHFADGGSTLPDWRNGVDEVLGARGWEPQLAMVRRELELRPSAEAFAAVKERYRAVNFSDWMEGVSFEEWRP